MLGCWYSPDHISFIVLPGGPGPAIILKSPIQNCPQKMNRFYRFYLVLTRQTWGAFNHCGRICCSSVDSFACDSCQFPWSTPHLVKTLEKQKKSRLFGRGGSQPRLSENCFFLFFWGGEVFGFFWFFQGFFWFWSLSAIRTFFYTGRSVSSCVQACRNQSFNYCSYEHTGSEDQDCVFQSWNVRPCPR